MKITVLFPLLILFVWGCGSNHQALSNKGNGHADTDSSKVAAPAAAVTLNDLLKPEFRIPTPSVPIEWKSDTLYIGDGTCTLYRKQPWFPDNKRPNAWLNERFDERMSIFVETCEEPEKEYAGGDFEGYFLGEVGRADANLLSLSTECSAHFPGGNKSHTGIFSVCFNATDGSELALHDLFSVEKDSVYRMLKRMVVARIDENPEFDNANEIVFDGGLNVPEEALGTFTIDSESLTIILHEGSSVRWNGPPEYLDLELKGTID